MAIPELAKFREKYPDYNDLDDTKLAGMLATKYPDAYGDLPGKLAAVAQPAIEMLPSHGQAPPVDGWKQTVSTYAKPVLEAGGMIAGGLVGTAAGPPGSVGGAALGYGVGRQAGKILDNFLIGTPAETPTAAVKGAGQDLITGAALEMGGQALLPAAALAFRPISKAVKGVTLPGTKQAAQKQASSILREASTPATAELSAAEAQNIARTDALLKRQGITDLQPSPAQKSGSYKEAYLEQGRTAANKELADFMTVNDANLANRARTNLTGTLKESAPISGRPSEEIGAKITSSLKTAKAPLEEAENIAWNSISKEYQMDTSGIDRTFTELENMTIEPGIKGQIAGLKEFYSGTRKTVGDIREVLKAVTEKIETAKLAGKDNEARIWRLAKKGFDDDFKAMGRAAKDGDVYEYGGKLVYPKVLQKEITDASQRIASMQQAGSVPDSEAVLSAIRAKGYPSMRSPGEDVTNFNKRMANDYRQYFGQEPPMIANPADVASLAAQQEKIANAQAILQGMKPAQDVAAQIKAANAATIEKQWRFGKGATADVLKYGNKDSGLKLDYEAIPGKYFGQSGAGNLIKAVGKPEASRLMSEHITTSFENLSKDGILDIRGAARFLDKNAAAIDKLGLRKDAEKLIREQIPAAIKQRMGQRLGADRIGNENNTLVEIRGIIKDFAPIMNRVYGKGSKEVTALIDYHQMLQVLGRNKGVTYAGGSNSIEKLASFFEQAPPQSLMRKIFVNLTTGGAGIGAVTAGPVGAVVGAGIGRGAQSAASTITAHQREAVAKLLDEAITNPEAAAFLLKVGRGFKPSAIEMEKELTKYGISWKATKTGIGARLIAPQLMED